MCAGEMFSLPISRDDTHFVVSDAVILGASSVKHLEENIKSTKHGPLHEGKSIETV